MVVSRELAELEVHRSLVLTGIRQGLLMLGWDLRELQDGVQQSLRDWV